MKLSRVLITALPLCSATTVALAGDEPIAWWKFDETGGSTAADSAGSFTGTLAGNASFTSGVSGNALDAGTGWVNMGDVLALTGTSFSMQTWIKTQDASSASTVIAGKHDAGYFNGHMMRTNFDGGAYGSPGKASFYQSNSPGATAVGTSTVTDGNWHHLVAVYDTNLSQLGLYVDGVRESLIATTPILTNSTAFLVAGFTRNGNVEHGFNGLIDEVQVYNYALSGDQVKFLYANPGSAIPAPGAAALGLAALAIGRRRR